MTQPRSGRRPGATSTRAAIEDAARRQFAELGYDRTSMRQVALAAGVDPALVSHFFGSKQALFASVAALPFDPASAAAAIAAGDPERAGERLAQFVLGVLEDEVVRSRVVGLVRAAASEPDAVAIVRERVTNEMLVGIARGVKARDPEYRATLVMSQIVGLVMARYIVGVEPLASQPLRRVAADLAPTLQRYLTAPLSRLR